MSGGSRKRDSKWDMEEESRLSMENARDSDWHGKYNDKQSPRSMYPHAAGNNGRRWESMPVNRGGHDNDTSTRPGDGNYDAPLSPGLDDWGQHHHPQSPKNEWNRSRRVHGRSRSGSRSRSRSPVRGYRRESDVYDRSRSKSGASAQVCKDYVVGRCRRGNHCHFLHQDSQNYEDNWETRDRKDGATKYSVLPNPRDYPTRTGRSPDFCGEYEKGSRLRGEASIGYDKGSANGLIGEKEKDRQNRDSLEKATEHEPRRNDIPCKFFTAGHCRNGKYCRFSHHGPMRKSPDRRPRDDRRVQSRYSDREKSWGSPKWSDPDPLSDKMRRTDVTAPELQMSSYSKGEPTSNRIGIENNGKKALMEKAENLIVNRGVTDPIDSHKWIDDVEMSPGLNFGMESSNNVVKEDHGRFIQSSQSPMLNDIYAHTMEKDITQGPRRMPHEAVKIEPIVIGKSYLKPDDDMKEGLRSADMNAVSNTPAILIDLNSSANTLPSFGHGSQGFSTTGLNQVPNSSKPLIIDNTNMSQQANVGIPRAQNIISSEQNTQLTNLSVSLAQLFGGQQLPQLYATLNSQNAVDMPPLGKSEGSVGLNFEASVWPNEVTGVQKQYNPVSTTSDHKTLYTRVDAPGLAPNLVEPKSTAERSPEQTPKNVLLNPTADPEVPKVKSVESQKVVEEKSTVQVNGLAEKLDDDKVEEGKKNKDAKVVRLFKFALAEFVKELLKPAWKEGQINKDDYKNIVKKVVDKVTGTMQGASVPQTQEKIDQYLSHSKPKLTKLVQAYVEKFQKGSKEA